MQRPPRTEVVANEARGTGCPCRVADRDGHSGREKILPFLEDARVASQLLSSICGARNIAAPGAQKRATALRRPEPASLYSLLVAHEGGR